jgi:hypothetical protein
MYMHIEMDLMALLFEIKSPYLCQHTLLNTEGGDGLRFLKDVRRGTNVDDKNAGWFNNCR